MLASNTNEIEPPVENDRVPVWPSRSGRSPNVISISGVVPSGHSGVTSMANGVGVGIVVVVLVVGGAVVVVVVVVEVVVVVGGGFGGGQSLGEGSGWPTSSAMMMLRP